MIDRRKLHPGDVLVEKPNGFFGFWAKLFSQKSQHVILVDHDTRYGWESVYPKVRRVELNLATPYVVLRTDCSRKTINMALLWAADQEGKIAYAVGNLAALAVMSKLGIRARPWKDDETRKQMVCSEFASEAFAQAGDDLFPTLEDQDIKPDDWLANPRCREADV